MAFASVQDKLRPPAALQPRAALGKTFKSNQPDVEVLGVLVRDVPTTMDAYSRLKGKNDWCSLQLVVLGTSGPGFSSVPYTSTKRKDEREVNPQPLYDTVPHSEPHAGLTRFYTYEKGRSNKDKGRRVETMTGAEPGTESACATAVLPAGVCISSFLREDAMTGDFFVEGGVEAKAECLDNGVLVANSLVRAVVAASNVDQAQKGMLLKIKKVKPVGCVSDAALAVACAAEGTFPRDENAYAALQDSVRIEFPAVARSVYAGNVKFFAPTLSARTFAEADEAAGRLVLVDADAPHGEIHVPAAVALAGTGAATLSRAAKIASLAVSQKALGAVVRTHRVDDVMLDSGPACTCVALSIDVGKLLGLAALTDASDWPSSGSLKMIHVGTDAEASPGSARPPRVLWTQPANQFWHDQNGFEVPRSLIFELELDTRMLEAPLVQSTDRFLADNAGGFFLPLRVYHCDPTLELERVPEELDVGDSVARLISLQLRPENRGQQAGRRRKRKALHDDEHDLW